MILIYILDIFLFAIFIINILYLAVFSFASLFKDRSVLKESTYNRRIVILIPAYAEDQVIFECVDSCLKQSYPDDMYDVVVISDRMSEKTNESLLALPIKLIKVYFENSTKAKALNYAMGQLGDNYDVTLILDADNTIESEFLTQINNVFVDDAIHIVQAHRCAKNMNTPLALLDALSEEINNSIFRKGHSNLGFSAALIGSGMCFDYMLFKTTMLKIDAIGGFDRALELILLRDNKRIFYMPYADVRDEKVQRREDFSRQRRRWLSAQFHYLAASLKYLPSAVCDRKWDFCDKMFQQMSIPRVMLLGFSVVIAVTISFIDFSLSVKWWVILLFLIIVLAVAIPKYLLSKKLFIAIIQLPYFFMFMAINLFCIKGANKKFIHTKHGVN